MVQVLLHLPVLLLLMVMVQAPRHCQLLVHLPVLLLLVQGLYLLF
jgi:hypothetical protein